MATKFVSSTTSRLYEQPKVGPFEMVLIFGDEVKTKGSPINGMAQAEFRGRSGFMDQNQLGTRRALEVYFIDVGQGDSTFIVTPQNKKILIDGGIDRRALGFLVWKYRLDIESNSVDIDLLVLSHADDDHIKGLIPIMTHPRIRVHKVVHNGIATFKKGAFGTLIGDLDDTKKYLVTRHSGLNTLSPPKLSDTFSEWRTALQQEGCSYGAVDADIGTLDVGDPRIAIEVLGPRLGTVGTQRALPWFGNPGETINGHSVLLRLTYDDASFLFAGDLNDKGQKYLMLNPAFQANSHVFKAPHHGSHKFDRSFLKTINPQISVISSGDEPDHGHPRAKFIGVIGSVSRSNSPLIFSTEIAATFVEAKDVDSKERETSLEGLDVTRTEDNAVARRRFKRRLHGMINVRTDGKKLYAARRVAAGYWWESYGSITPAP